MTNLKDILDNDPTLEAADRALEVKGNKEQRRTYLGMSSIGESCDRKLWYYFRWAGREKFDALTLKRFADGHRTEDLIIDRLKLVEGLDIVALTDDGSQIKVTDHAGHFSGHLDGTVLGLLQAPKTKHVLEVKCVSEKKMSELNRAVSDVGEKLALKKWNPTYYAQAQCYMHYTGLKRHWTVVTTAGGRTWRSVRTEYNQKDSQKLVDRAKRIINSNEPLDRVSNDPSWYECKAFKCPMYGVCHEMGMPDRTCRTCLHSTPNNAGQWECERWGKILTPQEQADGCGAHKYLPKLVPAEIIHADDKGVTYKMADGSEWYDGE